MELGALVTPSKLNEIMDRRDVTIGAVTLPDPGQRLRFTRRQIISLRTDDSTFYEIVKDVQANIRKLQAPQCPDILFMDVQNTPEVDDIASESAFVGLYNWGEE